MDLNKFLENMSSKEPKRFEFKAYSYFILEIKKKLKFSKVNIKERKTILSHSKNNFPMHAKAIQNQTPSSGIAILIYYLRTFIPLYLFCEYSDLV